MSPPDFPPRSLTWVVVWYAVAKALEHFDRPIFEALRFVSGHSLKHVTAAVSTDYLLAMFNEKLTYQHS